MNRVSDFTITIPCDDSNTILLHGYTGAVDIVSNDVGLLINESMDNPIKINDFSEDELRILQERGYITELSKIEEKDEFKRVAKTMKKIRENFVSATILVTYNCNFRCSYCFEQNNFKLGNNFLSNVMNKKRVDQIFDVLESLKKDGKHVQKEIMLFGGEPLLKENFEIVEYIVGQAKNYGYTLGAITNGYDLDSYGELLGKGKIERLQITLDGDEEVHNSRRFLLGGEKTFNRIIENIDGALKKGVNLNIRINIDLRNLKQLNVMSSFFEEKGWNEKTNFHYYFKDVNFNCKSGSTKYDLSEKEIIEDMLKNETEYNKHTRSGTEKMLEDSINYLLKNKSIMIMKPDYCGATNGMKVFDPFGDVYSCWNVVGNGNMAIGRVEGDKIIYNDNYHRWNNRTVVNIDECSNCPYALFCGGGCAYNAISNGTIDTAQCDDFKEIFHSVFRNAIKEQYID